jgi:hypothetical protein
MRKKMPDEFDPVRGRKHDIHRDRTAKMREAMKEYDETVHYPALKQLREDCAKLGHYKASEENSDSSRRYYDKNYHDNGLGWAKLRCCYCDTAIKIWLDGEELKVVNGDAVSENGNWIKINGETMKIEPFDAEE